MDDGQEHDQYEERLKEVFNSFDTSGCGSLCPEELSDLCLSLHLDDATPALLDTLLQNQDRLTARVDFDQFKNALILVLSSNILTPKADQESPPEPDSPEIQPKFVKGSKRYGRRSTPEFTDPILDSPEDTHAKPAKGEELEDGYDSAVPRKRERWNGHETSTEEYEAEGQMHLWNPDEPSTPCVAVAPLPNRLEERLHHACDELAISWNGCAGHTELLALCDYLDLELTADMLQSLNVDGVTNVQEFVSMVVTHNKPPTPSASTPYRQLKRLHSTQPFDKEGRRITTPSALSSSIGMRLFSTLDDGSGLTPAEYVMDAWIEEGIENSAEILQALNFSLDGKLSLNDLTLALENELLVTKNGIHQAALASFKAEIRYLLECVDRELREKEKIRSDLEKAEKLKTQLATEVDEHHLSIEHKNNLNLRKLEQDHKEKLAAVRAELIKEMDQIQQQAALQREELEADMEKVREDESFLRDHLSISLKENRRLEMELLDSTEKLIETQGQVSKLQTSLDNIMKEKFGDLDPGSADFFLQEERIKQMRSTYEAQCRELQDRIDELQSELQEFHSLSRPHQPCHKPLSEELESKSPGMESDPGIGSEEVHPLSLSLEAEMMLEQLKEQHLQEMEELRNQLESKISEFAKMVEKQRATQEEQKAASALLHQQEVRALREQIANIQSHAQEIQSQLEQAELERTCLVLKPVGEREELEHFQEEEVAALREQLLEARTLSADLEEQLKTLAAQEAVNEQMLEELRNQHAMQLDELEKKHTELFNTKIEEARNTLQEEKAVSERRLLEEFEREREQLKQSHEDELKARLEEAGCRFEEERSEVVQKLTEQWQNEKARLDEQNNESLQVLLEEEMLRLVKEQEEKELQLRKEWDSEKAQLLQRHQEDLHARVLQERVQIQEQCEQRERKLKKEWEEERLQLEEDYEGMLQERLTDEKEKLENEKEEFENRLEHLMAEEKNRLEERHREAMQELTDRHSEERNKLSSMLDQLRDDVAQERGQIEISFSQRIKEVEDRFSDEQESVEARFQADVLKLEHHYQSDLKVLSESHEEQKLKWEAQMLEAFEKAEEQRKIAEETFNLEREEWKQERLELEKNHSEEVEVLVIKNQQFESELNNFVVTAQARETELSQQLNDLHNRLQGSLQTKEELLAQLDRKAAETELLLHHTVEDFGQERAELLSSQSKLEAKYNVLFSISERQTKERIELLTERDDLKMKVEELERLLTQAAEDFIKERDELQEYIVFLEEQVKEEDRPAGIRITENSQALAAKERVKSSLINTEECESLCEERQEISSAHAADVGNTQSNNEEGNEEYAATNDKDNVPKIETGATDEEVLEVRITNDDSQCETTAGVDAAEDLNPEVGFCCSSQTKLCHDEDPDMASCVDHNPEPPERACGASVDVEDKKEAVSSDKQGKVEEVSPSLEAFEGEDTNRRPRDGEKTMSPESCEDKNKPQNVPALDPECASSEDELCHETALDLSELEETGDPSELAPENVLDNPLSDVSHMRRHQSWSWEHSAAERRAEDTCAHDALERQDFSFFHLQGSYCTATEENVLLREKVVLLQQKSEMLENLLAHSNEKLRSGHQFLEENYSLKVKMLMLMEHMKVLELKALTMADLQIRYEDCLCENAKLKDQNSELEKRVWSLESSMNTFPEDENVSLVDEVRRMQEENQGLSELFRELGMQMPPEEALLNLSVQLCANVQAVSGAEDSCLRFEQHNTRLRRAISALRDNSQTLNETTQAHRSASVRLAEENIILRQKIAALKEEDLKEAQEELMQTMEHLNKERLAAQKTAESFNKQISELRLQNHQLTDENGTLSEKDAQNIADMEKLQHRLAELITEKDRREAFPAEERDKLAACVSALEAELNGALEETARLEERNSQLSQQLSELREKVIKTDSLETQLGNLVENRKGVEQEIQGLHIQLAKAQEMVKTAEETLQAVNHESVRLKSDIRVVQQERDSLQHEVSVLRKQLQNANDKNHVLEKAFQSTGLHHQSKKLCRDELSRLKDQDGLSQTREKVRQLDSTISSLRQHKQQSQSTLVRALEQENASLKQELEAQKELAKGRESVQGHAVMENLQQENEALKAQIARMSTHLFESFHAHLVGLLPPSPHRMPRGQHLAEDGDIVQDEREMKMKNMEERMKEIELSLRNVKLLLKEKVAQLKDQLHRNGKADVLIKDLYVENAQLLKALEVTEQRHKIAEKKNYLLEEKISSLNKIVRDLNPSPLSSLSYQFQSS